MTTAERFEHPADFWRPTEEGARCELCPHGCELTAEAPEGHCGLRFFRDGTVRTRGWGGAAALQLDPVEKKPLFHFLPGTRTLSLGMNGCNLDCVFCQNSHLSMQRGTAGIREPHTPASIVETAREVGARSVALTYNEPTIAAEFGLAVAEACHGAGLPIIAVSNGFAAVEAGRTFYGAMDAANIDLKAFHEGFYREHCGAHLAPVLRTLRTVAALGTCHLEVTTLLVPGRNDTAEELTEEFRWLRRELGPAVPLHLTAFHPAYRALHWTEPPVTTASAARELALAEGLQYVYTGNILDPHGQATVCPACGRHLIERTRYQVQSVLTDDGCCDACGAAIPGRWN